MYQHPGCHTAKEKKCALTEGEAFAHTSSFQFFGPTPGFYLELHYTLLDNLYVKSNIFKVQSILKTGIDIALIQAVGSAELNIYSQLLGSPKDNQYLCNAIDRVTGRITMAGEQQMWTNSSRR